MRKGLVPQTDYKFAKGNAGSGTITFSSNYTGITLGDVLYIVNVKSTTATVIYDPSDATKGGTMSGNVLTLAFDTSSMANTDTLQIFTGVGEEAATIDDVAQILLRALRKIEHPTYMNPVGEVKVQLQATGTSPVTVTSLPNLPSMGAATSDQSFNVWMQNRQIFNDFINNRIS